VDILKHQPAQALVEYALVVSLLALAAIVGLWALGPRLAIFFGATTLSGPVGPGGF
jgi:Flp pilus assembly pilin Flp